MNEWWSLGNNEIKIYTENLEKINDYPTPSTIHYKRKSVKGNTIPIFAVEYLVKLGSKEQKSIFKDFGVKLNDKRRD